MKKIPFLIIFFALFPTISIAYELPPINVTDINIEKISNNTIDGNFSIINPTPSYVGGLKYEIQLLKGSSLNDGLAGREISTESVSLSPKETLTISFSYKYPENIVSGDYMLLVQLVSVNGDMLGWDYKSINLQGNNKFLDISNSFSRVFVGDNDAFALQGISVNASDIITNFLQITNPGKSITVVPHIKIYDRQVNMTVIKEYDDSPITFSDNESKEIRLVMPKLEKPGSYLSEVKFLENKKQVSGIAFFRWVIKGSGGKILYIKTDKDYYKPGESMTLTIDSIGPADFSDLGTGKLEIIIFGKNGKKIYETFKEVEINSDVQSTLFSIPINDNLVSPSISAKLLKDSVILDEQDIKLSEIGQSEEAKKLEKEMLSKIWNSLLVYFSYLILLIVLIVGGFFAYKKFKSHSSKK